MLLRRGGSFKRWVGSRGCREAAARLLVGLRLRNPETLLSKAGFDRCPGLDLRDVAVLLVYDDFSPHGNGLTVEAARLD